MAVERTKIETKNLSLTLPKDEQDPLMHFAVSQPKLVLVSVKTNPLTPRSQTLRGPQLHLLKNMSLYVRFALVSSVFIGSEQ